MSDEQMEALSPPEIRITPDQDVEPAEHARPFRRQKQARSSTRKKSPVESTSRWFFPCNREDALVLLGSLFISPAFFLNSVRLAVQDDGLAILAGGLNESEEALVTGGRPERFPLLVEVDASVVNRSPRTISYTDIVGLIFRNRQEADDFRFRPVEEFDTEAFMTEVEPPLFGCEGDARFTIRPPLGESDVDLGYIADRLVAGIQGIVSLGRLTDDLAPAIRDFLASPRSDADGQSLDLATACSGLGIRPGQGAPTRRQAVILAAFANDEGRGTRASVDGIARRLAASGGRSDDEARQESRWASVAHDVIRGRIELDGNQVSDHGSVLLRGALLGAVADKPTSLVAFLKAAEPSGNRVTVVASFFVGLKRGVLHTSWKEKEADARWMSLLLREVIVGRVGQDTQEQLIAAKTIDADGRSMISISAAGHEVAAWNLPHPMVEADLVKEWPAAFASAGYEVLGPGTAPHSWIVELSPGQPVEISYAEANNIAFPILRYHFDDGVRLKKVKEIADALDHGAMFWHKARDGSGRNYLYCDLPALPAGDSRTLLSAKLAHAISLSTIPKAAKSKRKRARKTSNAETRETLTESRIADAPDSASVPTE